MALALAVKSIQIGGVLGAMKATMRQLRGMNQNRATADSKMPKLSSDKKPGKKRYNICLFVCFLKLNYR